MEPVPLELGPQAFFAGGQLRFLRLLELELCPAALRDLAGEWVGGAAHPGQRLAKAAQNLAHARRDDLPCDARLLQIHGILCNDGSESLGPRRTPAEGAHSRAAAAA